MENNLINITSSDWHPPPLRSRLDTAETMQIKNIKRDPCVDISTFNPSSSFLPPFPSATTVPCSPLPSRSDASAVSSLSEGSFCRQQTMVPIVEDDSPFVPPAEISITIRRKVPNWLRDGPSPNMPPAPVWTGAPSPARLRPSLGRNSCGFSGSNFPAQTTIETIESKDSIDHSWKHPQQLDYSSSSHSLLVGQRHRRQHRRNLSSTTFVSTGSVLCRSSCITLPTATQSSSSSFSDLGHPQQHDCRSLTQLRPYGMMEVYSPGSKPSLVRSEIKYMWGKVSSPIRQLIKSDEKVNLHRSSGCLT